MATTFRELSDSPREHFGRDGVRFSRRFLVDYADRWTFLRETMGDGEAFGGVPPVGYPGFSSAKPVSFDTEPFTERLVKAVFSDVGEDLNTYLGYALITINYEPIDLGLNWPTGQINFPMPEVGYLNYRMSFAAASRMIGGSGLAWAGAQPSMDITKNDIEPVTDSEFSKFQRMHDHVHILTWSRVTSPPFWEMRRYINHVNMNNWRGFHQETLLFEGAEAEIEIPLPGDLDETRMTWRITYTFRERRIDAGGGIIYGWQHDYRTDPGKEGWEVLTDSNGNRLYPYVTFDGFDSLFQITQDLNED